MLRNKGEGDAHWKCWSKARRLILLHLARKFENKVQ